jgi:hypothetical protein
MYLFPAKNHQRDCTDEPDTATETYTNDGSSSVAVYFVVDGYNSGDHGDFTIEWALELPVPTTPTESPTVSPTGSPTGTPPPGENVYGCLFSPA